MNRAHLYVLCLTLLLFCTPLRAFEDCKHEPSDFGGDVSKLESTPSDEERPVKESAGADDQLMSIACIVESIDSDLQPFVDVDTECTISVDPPEPTELFGLLIASSNSASLESEIAASLATVDALNATAEVDLDGYSPCAECASCCCCPCRCGWWFSADAVFLRRADSGNVPLIISQRTGDTIVNADQLEFDHRIAPQFSLIRQYCSCWGWGVGFLGIDSWKSTGMNDTSDSPILIAPGFPVGSTAPGSIASVDAGSSLYSAEFNLRRRCHEDVTLIAGFRWIEFDDTLRGYTASPSLTDIYALRATNHMYGFQVGADADLLCWGRFQMNAVTRVGVMANHVDYGATTPLATSSNGLISQVRAGDDTTSLAAGLGLRGLVAVTEGLSVYGGYQAMWLDGVALAAQQLPSTSLVAPGAAAIDTSSTLLFHGASVGVQVSY